MILRRKPMALLGVAILLVTCLMLYLAIEVSQLPTNDGFKVEAEKNELNILEVRLSKLEDDLKENHRVIDEIMATVKGFFSADFHPPLLLNGDHSTRNVRVPNSSSADCSLVASHQLPVNIQMLSLYEKLNFDNSDGGVWKQGWNIEYDSNQWSQQNKLKVFVVPHSHNDPGWIKTFDKYFMDQTRHILDNMVKKLGEDSRRTFIWAEISYFSKWWTNINGQSRDLVKKYLENGQLEIVTGGWVMTDEANSHYFAILLQMIEGHEWLLNHVGVTPRSGWSIDPFGMSPTMAYLLRRMGFNSMLIQRVHYNIKKYFAKHKSLEFMWKQTWDYEVASTDMLCHMMPFYSYDVPHTCGPDPKVCCQFDFKRLPGGKMNCPWRVAPQPITPTNVANRANLLLDQYRKKAQLYSTNVLLVPLGDDFRYDKAQEWDQQFRNYQALFDYMNGRQELNVKAQFGTLQDYFQALLEELTFKAQTGNPLEFLPTVSGDFFTYADRDDHYWSGYFTSRPFYKKMNRILEATLRGTEILFSIAAANMTKAGLDADYALKEHLKVVVEARRSLGLFQHHDAITGTAKDFVVIDYANKMLKSILELQKVMTRISQYLLLNADLDLFRPSLLVVDEARDGYSSIPEKMTIDLSNVSHRLVVLYNSLGQRRQELVSVHVNTPYVCIRDSNGNVVPNEVHPIWLQDRILPGKFQVYFIEDVPALGFTSYSLKAVTKSDSETCQITVPSISLYNTEWRIRPIEPFNSIEEGTPSEFILSNMNVEAVFHPTGLLKALKLKNDGITLNTELQFLKYGVRTSKERSGAYLFLPDREAQTISVENPVVHVTRGNLLSEVHVYVTNVLHKVQVKNSPGPDGYGIDINNVVDITPETNQEIVMRVISDVANSERDMFTDLNGFQVLRRKTFTKLPLQGNFYPIPTLAYLEDNETRFSILTAQPLGVASLEQGWLEIMMDRKLNQDDNRGLEQGVTDNVLTPNSFRFLLEKREAVKIPYSKNPNGFPSLAGHSAVLSLLHPTFSMIAVDNVTLPVVEPYSVLKHDLPCDMHVVIVRTSLIENEREFALHNSTALILHRLGHDCRISHPGFYCNSTNGLVSIGDIFPNLFVEEVTQMSLSLLYEGKAVKKSQNLHLEPMELYTFRLSR